MGVNGDLHLNTRQAPNSPISEGLQGGRSPCTNPSICLFISAWLRRSYGGVCVLEDEPANTWREGGD